MAYTTIDDPGINFNTLLYTGNGATSSAGTTARTLTGVGFQPDWVWLKERSNTEGHFLQDSVRGASKVMFSNLNNAEVDSLTDYSDGGLNGFISDGFTIGSGHAGNSNNINTNSETYVAWNWKAGGSASSNSDGTITSSVSASTTAGFSVVSYTSNGSASQTVGHGLGAVPQMIISKNRDSGSSSYNYWTVYHHSLATANDKKLKLNTTDAASSTNEWGDTDPTSTVYSVHTGGDGTTNHQIEANSGAVEDASGRFNFLSNGFKCVSSSTGSNGSGTTYIYMAFAESPFVNSNSVPNNAR